MPEKNKGGSTYSHLVFQSVSNYKFLMLPNLKQVFIFAFVSTAAITDFLHCFIIFVCVLVVLLVNHFVNEQYGLGK